MSGHSHWATIRRKKGAADAKRGQLFTRLAREIALAARESGGDVNSIRLAFAIDKARANNMPKENIERAIKRGTGDGKDGAALEEITYEGIGPHGVGLMIAVVTDNRNRTVAELRHQLSKAGGTMSEAGTVAWQFKRVSFFSFPAQGQDPDKMFELAVEAGADDVITEDETIEIVGPVEAFKTISDALRAAKVHPEDAGLKLVPTNELELSPEQQVQVMKVIEAIEDLDDVQDVYSTLKVTDEAVALMEND